MDPQLSLSDNGFNMASESTSNYNSYMAMENVHNETSISYSYTTPEMAQKVDESSDSETEDFPSEEVLQLHIDFITAVSENAVMVPHELGIKYGSSKSQKLDIFGIDLPDNAPIVVYLPGGFWKQLSKNISRYPVLPLYSSGIKTMVAGYSVRRKVTLWDIVDQVELAILYALGYARDKGSKGVYLAGHCSGAHLIAQVLCNSEIFEDVSFIDRLKGVFLISGIYNLRDFYDTPATKEINLEKIECVSLSPLYNIYHHLVSTSVKFYILTGQNDSEMLKKQSRDFYDLLQDICPTNNTYFEVKDGMNHFDMVACFSAEDNYLQRIILNDISKQD